MSEVEMQTANNNQDDIIKRAVETINENVESAAAAASSAPRTNNISENNNNEQQTENETNDDAPSSTSPRNPSPQHYSANLPELSFSYHEKKVQPFHIYFVNFGLLIAFLVATLITTSNRSQYLALCCFILPILVLIWFVNKIRNRWQKESRQSVEIEVPSTTSVSEKNPQERFLIAECVSRFIIGFICLIPCIIGASLFLSISLMFLLGILLMHASAEVAHLVGMFCFISIFVAGEECSKLMVYYVFDKRTGVKRPEYFLYFGMATALGLSSAEVFWLVREVSFALYMDRDMTRVPASEVLGLLAIFTLFCIPMHMLSSYYLGLGAAKVQVLGKSPQAILPPVLGISILCRSLFLEFVFMLAMPKEFAVGMILAILVFAGFVYVVLQYQEQMPADYLRSTGKMEIFGYGVLATSEESSRQNIGQPTYAQPNAAERAQDNAERMKKFSAEEQDRIRHDGVTVPTEEDGREEVDAEKDIVAPEEEEEMRE